MRRRLLNYRAVNVLMYKNILKSVYIFGAPGVRGFATTLDDHASNSFTNEKTRCDYTQLVESVEVLHQVHYSSVLVSSLTLKHDEEQLRKYIPPP